MINIRRFLQEDKQSVIDFFDEMGEETRFYFKWQPNFNNAMKFFEGDDSSQAKWIAFDSDTGKAVGYVFLRGIDKPVPSFGIAVADGYKGMHIGTRLIETAIDFARNAGKDGVFLRVNKQNTRAQALYKKHGFVIYGEDNDGEYTALLDFKKEKK